MASNFPKLPGFVPTHDPTLVNHRKVSHVKQEQIRNGKNIAVPLYDLPRPPAANFTQTKAEESKSFSQTVFPNHFGADINEQFEPTFVKLDKQVRRSINGVGVISQYFKLQHIHILSVGSTILRLLQGECGREQDGELQNQEANPFLLFGRSHCHDKRTKRSQQWGSTRSLPETPNGAERRRILDSPNAN
jgi:hypothetical protein